MKKLLLILTAAFFFFFVAATLLNGCAITSLNHEVAPNGTTSDSFQCWSLWADPALRDLDIGTTQGTMERHLRLGEFSRDSSTGQKDFNKALPVVAEKAVKGAVEGLAASTGNPLAASAGATSILNTITPLLNSLKGVK